MSWDASLAYHGDTTSGYVVEQNYTHNTSPMIYGALADQGMRLPGGVRWWGVLSGLDGKDGADFLGLILLGLRADPERFRAMNPENGWGDFDQLVEVLTAMHTASEEHPHARWTASG